MKDLIEDLYLTNRALVSDGFDQSLNYIDEHELPLDVHEYPSGEELWNSWIIPQKWSVNHARIQSNGETILDYEDHPLHLIACSDSFEGYVSREEIVDHIHTHAKIDHAIPWHFRLMYRPWQSEWGFCASQNFVDSLDEDEYYVSIDTTFEDGQMKVAEHHLEGRLDETILIVAHLDHTGQANDDLSGVSAGIELMRRLAERDELKYSYKLLLVPEIIGSVAYLSHNEELAEHFRYSVFLEAVGTELPILFQRTFTGETKLDDVAEFVLRDDHDDYEIREYREVAGDDELIYEAPDFEIPMISVSRYPFREYHTHLDNPSIISETMLEETVEYVLHVFDILERDYTPVRTFTGVPSLANPKYDLYLEPGQPALANSEEPTVALDFKDRIFRYLDGEHTVFEIANHFDLDFEFVHDYLRDFEEKDLIEVEEAPK